MKNFGTSFLDAIEALYDNRLVAASTYNNIQDQNDCIQNVTTANITTDTIDTLEQSIIDYGNDDAFSVGADFGIIWYDLCPWTIQEDKGIHEWYWQEFYKQFEN